MTFCLSGINTEPSTLLINTHNVLTFSSATDRNTSYNKLISKAYETKFLRIYVDRILFWKIHIEQIKHKLRTACYAMGSVKPFMSQEILKMVYYVYFHTITRYGIILLENCPHSVKCLKYKEYNYN